MRRRLAVPVLLACGLLAAACRWSVPADPGENARTRTRPAPEPTSAAAHAATAAPGRADPGGAAVYAEKCGACHAPFPPTYASAEEWPTFVRRYGPRANLFGAERARVLAWLQDHAR